MKFTVHGYTQQVAVNLGLDNNDLLILRWFQDFIDTGSMEQKVINGETYYWIRYDYLLEQLPILGCTKQVLSRKIFKKIVDSNVLDFQLIKQKGNYSYYKFNENDANYKALIDPEYYNKTVYTDEQDGMLKPTHPIVETNTPYSCNEQDGMLKPTYPIVETNTPYSCNEQDGMLKPTYPMVETNNTKINLLNTNLSNINQSNINFGDGDNCQGQELYRQGEQNKNEKKENDDSFNNNNQNTNNVNNYQNNNSIGDIDNLIKTVIKSDEVQTKVYDFIQHRKSLKFPMNDNSIKELVSQLNRYNEQEQLTMLSTAIVGGHKAVIPPTNNYSNSNNNGYPNKTSDGRIIKSTYTQYKNSPKPLPPGVEIDF